MASLSSDMQQRIARELAAATPAVRTSETVCGEDGVREQERVLVRLGLLAKTRTNEPAEVREAVQGLAQSAECDSETISGALTDLAGAPCATDPDCHECRMSAVCRHAQRGPTLKEIPEDQRPRERLMHAGPEALTDAELMAIVIRDGTTKASSVDLAQRLLKRFGGLRGVSERATTELCSVAGIGPAKASQVLAALSLARRLTADTLKKGTSFQGSEQVFEHLYPKLRSEKQEKFLALLLDAKNRVLRVAEISTGGLTGSAVKPRDVFRPALTEAASAVIFIHNHPSGDPTPSRDDLTVTRRLVQAGELLGLRVLDHIIIGEEGYRSLADEGKMK